MVRFIRRHNYRLLALGAGLGLSALAGACQVLVTNPEHCWNAHGDLTCRGRFGDVKPFCSTSAEGCGATEDFGCVAAQPVDACWSPCGGGLSAVDDKMCLGTDEVADSSESGVALDMGGGSTESSDSSDGGSSDSDSDSDSDSTDGWGESDTGEPPPQPGDPCLEQDDCTLADLYCDFEVHACVMPDVVVHVNPSAPGYYTPTAALADTEGFPRVLIYVHEHVQDYVGDLVIGAGREVAMVGISGDPDVRPRIVGSANGSQAVRVSSEAKLMLSHLELYRVQSNHVLYLDGAAFVDDAIIGGPAPSYAIYLNSGAQLNLTRSFVWNASGHAIRANTASVLILRFTSVSAANYAMYCVSPEFVTAANSILLGQMALYSCEVDPVTTTSSELINSASPSNYFMDYTSGDLHILNFNYFEPIADPDPNLDAPFDIDGDPFGPDVYPGADQPSP